MLHHEKICTKKCTSGKFAHKKVHGMCTNVDYVIIYNVCELFCARVVVLIPRYVKIIMVELITAHTNLVQKEKVLKYMCHSNNYLLSVENTLYKYK